MTARPTDVMPDFGDWCRQLWVEVRARGESQFDGSMMIDAAIPYRLGWSPDRAARAILRLTYRDYQRLVRIVREDEMEEGRAQAR